MAFTFTVGGSDTAGANSYASVQNYLDFHGDVGQDGADLTALDVTVIQRHLVSGTRWLDSLRWNGEAKYTDNVARLGLPRNSMVVGDGNPHLRPGDTLDPDEVPWVAVHAVCILAEEERVSGKTLWRPSRDRSKVLKSKRSIVGSTKTYADPLAARQYPKAMALVAGLHSGNKVSRRAYPL